MTPIKEIKCSTSVQLGATAELHIKTEGHNAKATSITYHPDEMKFVVKAVDSAQTEHEVWVFSTNVQWAKPVKLENQTLSKVIDEPAISSTRKTRTRTA